MDDWWSAAPLAKPAPAPAAQAEPAFDPVAGAVSPMLARKEPAPAAQSQSDDWWSAAPLAKSSMAGMDAPLPPPRPADLDTGLNVPEPPATIAAQQAQVGKGTGTGARLAVMFPQGSQEPELPEDWSRITTPRGVFHYDPSQVKASRIRELSAQGKENEILGLGPVSKPDADKRVAQGEQPVTVVERQPDGTEVKAAVGTPSTIDKQAAALEKGKLPGSTIEVEQPLSTAMRRVAQNPPMPPARPADLGAPVAPEATALDQPPLPALGFDIDPDVQAQRDNTRQVNKDGTTFGMLTPAEGRAEFDQRIAGAEEGLRKADERLKVAEDRAKLLANLPKGARGSQTEMQRQVIEQEYANATDARISARKALDAAKALPAPSMTATRSALEGGAQRALEMPVGAVGGLGRPIDAVLGTDIGGAADRERTRIEGAFKGDVARAGDFGQELSEGAGSMVGFIMGGAIGRSAGLSQKATSMGIGGFQNADEMYREAEKQGAEGWKKAAAYIAGGAVGMTEGFGSGRLLDHLAGVDKATSGGVRRYLGIILKQKGEEGLQEAVQSLGNDLAKLGVLGVDPGDMTENALKNAFLGAILGGATAGVLGLPTLAQRDRLGDALKGLVPDAPQWSGDEFGRPTAQGAPTEAAGERPAPPQQGPQQPTSSPLAQPTPESTPTAEASPPQPAQEAAPDDTGLLRAAGYSDEDIADMNPTERAAALDDARKEGITPAPENVPTRTNVPIVPVVPPADSSVDDVFGVPLDETIPEGKRPFIAEPSDGFSAGRRGEVIRVDSDGTWTVSWESGLTTEVSPAYRSMYQTDAPKLPAPAPGTRSAPVKVETEADIEPVRQTINPEPSQAQIAAGNYQKGHVRFEGLDLSLENPKGGTRRGTDSDGKPWEATLPADYGYIKGTKGADGDHVDIFVGPKGATGAAYVIEQINPKTGKFDEIKVITGVESADEARAIYEGAFSDGSGASRIGGLVPMSGADLKTWLIDKQGGRGPVPKRWRGQAEAIQAGQKNNAPVVEPAAGNEPQASIAPPEFTPLAQAQPGDLIQKGKELVERGLPRRDAVKLARETKGAAIIPDGNRWAVIAPPERVKVRTGQSNTRDKQGRPLSLVAFLRKEGGIKDQRGELRSRDMHRAHPGLVNNKRGLDLDTAREMAAEAGYLAPTEASALSYTDGAVATTRINDLLDALDNHPTYSVRDQQAVDEAAAEREGDEIQQRIDEMKDAIRADLYGLDFTDAYLDDNILTVAAEMVIDGSLDFESAYDNAAMLYFRDEIDAETPPNEPEIEWARILEEFPFDSDTPAQVRAEPAAEGIRAGDRAPAASVYQDDEPGAEVAGAGRSDVSAQEAGDDNRDADEVEDRDATIARKDFPGGSWIRLFKRDDGTYDADYNLQGQGGGYLGQGESLAAMLPYQRQSLGWFDNPAGSVPEPKKKIARQMLAWLEEQAAAEAPAENIAETSADTLAEAIEDIAAGQGNASLLHDHRSPEAAHDFLVANGWTPFRQGSKGFYFMSPDGEGYAFTSTSVEGNAQQLQWSTFGSANAPKKPAAPVEEPIIPAGYELTAVRPLTNKEAKDDGYDRGTFKAIVVSKKPYGAHDAYGDTRAEAISKALDRAQSYVAKLEKPEPTTEKGADGKPQTVIPGAEKIGDGKLAQIKADAPLKPKAPQKDVGGLFGDSMDQADLMDLANAPPKAPEIKAKEARSDWMRDGDEAATEIDGFRIGDEVDVPSRTIGRSTIEGLAYTPMFGRRIGTAFIRDNETGKTLRLNSSLLEKASDIKSALSAPPVEDAREPKRLENIKKLREIYTERGKQDFADGKNSTPPADVRSAGLDAMDAWTKAWNAANAAAPVPGVTDSPEWLATTQENFPTKAALAAENAVVEAFRQHFASPDGKFRTIIEARKFANENGFKPVDGVPANKQIEELIEHALVLAARDIIAASKKRGAGEVYQRLVDLYNRQPKLGSRTSTSVSEQAYSTPMPLAFLASRLAGITNETTVFEPTAGNGALLIEAKPSLVIANELNDIRRANLKAQGIFATGNDATDMATLPKPVDAVIGNPPFGSVREGGESKVWAYGDYKTTNIDHIISLQALRNMTPDGRAVLIIGGIKADSEKERSKGYTGSAKRKFFFRLMNEYNVTDIFTVDGDLYERQGAGWPVDVIVIEGKGKSARKPPSADVPRLFKSWEELKEKLDGHGFGEATARPQGVAGQDERPARVPAETGGRSAGDDGLAGIPADVGGPAVELAAEGFDPNVDDQLPAGEPGNVLGEQRPGNGASADQSTDVRDAGSPDLELDTDLDGLDDAPVESNATGQAAYRPSSKRGVAINTLVPTNLATVTRDSLRRVEEAHGKVDAYVARELGYKVEELGQYFSAEQIDAIALAMDNIEKGAGFIIGDQTGIGKGRVVAAAIRYAHKKGMTPLFVTEKPDLYGDMWRDLHDIGFDKYLGRPIEMFMTNSGVRVPLDDEAVSWSAERDAAKDTGEKAPPQRGAFSKSQDTKRASEKMREILAGTYTPDVVFTTYDQMNSVAGKETDRRGFLTAVASRAFLIMDETHNAGGTGNDGWEAKDKAPPRSKLFREAVDAARAVLYSSATYAKSPKVMDLFSRTDMSLAVEDKTKLPELIASGGVPLQQAVSSMLARSGQYMRRERSFEGISYDVESAPVDLKMYGNFSTGLRNIFRFDLAFAKDRQEIADGIAAELGAGTARDGGVGDSAANTTAFASIMHNAVNQMVLSIKARAAGQRAIDALKAGEKPVIALSSTMEAFITDAAEAADISFGDAITLDFGDVLKRYLERTRRVTITMPDDTKKHVMIPLEQMPTHLLDAYNSAMDFLNGLDFSQMPISPIDYIRNEITRAGYSVREITGRDSMVDYGVGNAPIYSPRPKSEQGVTGKRISIKDFNDGKLDVLILNRSGSTGVSLHAKKGFKDTRKRRMILVQADPNIDTHMQMLGRVNRTGQVVLPAYTQLMADIPAEARPAAVLLKKMASLNANTTASRKGALSGDTVDFINEYGDQVVAMALAEDSQTNALMNYPLKDNDGTKKAEGIAAKATGKLALLKPDEQQAFLDRVTESYTQLIDTLDKAGENKLEAKSIDLQTITEETTSLKPATGPSPFQASVDLEKVSAKAQGRAMAPDDVLEAAREALGLKEIPTRYGADAGFNRLAAMADEGRRKFADLKTRMAEEHAQHKRALLGGMKDADGKAKAEAKEDANFSRWEAIASLAKIGSVIDYETSQGGDTAVVIGFSRAAKAKSPLALSAWTLTLAVPNSSRTIGIPLSQVYTGAFPLPDGGAGLTISHPVRPPSYTDLGARFEEARKEGRETRYVVTGNILAGFEQTKGKGQIVSYTTADGQVRQGILMSRNFDPAAFFKDKGVRFKSGSQVIEFVNRVRDSEVLSADDIITVRAVTNYRTNAKSVEFELPSAKGKGGVYFTDKTLRAVFDGWEKRGTKMRADVNPDLAGRMIDAMMQIGAKFVATDNLEEARAITGEAAPETMKAPQTPPARAMAEPSRPKLTQGAADAGLSHAHTLSVVTDIVRRVVGRNANINVVDKVMIGGQSVAGSWSAPDLLLSVAMDASNKREVAYHEAFHALQTLGAFTEQETALMEREAPRHRAMVQQLWMRRSGTQFSMGLPVGETSAYAFGFYAESRESGESLPLHIGVRRAFDKVLEILRRIRNYFEGLGFRTSEDIFAQAFEGGYRNNVDLSRSWDQPAQAARLWNEGPGARAMAAVPRVAQSERGTTSEAIENIADRFVRIRELQNQFKRDSGLTNVPDVHRALGSMDTRIAARVEDMVDEELNPLLDKIEAAGGEERVHRYLYVRHAQERNEYIAQFNAGMPDGGSGIDTATAQAELAAFQASADIAELDAAAAALDAIIQRDIDERMNAGLLSAQQVADLRAMFKHYVPLRGFESDEFEKGTPLSGVGISVARRESPIVRGRKSLADSIIAQTISMRADGIVRAQKNRVDKMLFALAQMMQAHYGKASPMKAVTKPPMVQGGGSGKPVFLHVDQSYDMRPDVVAAKVGGKPRYVEFVGEPRLAEQLKNQMLTQDDIGINALGALTRVMGRMWTVYNPLFAPVNTVRDFLDASVASTALIGDGGFAAYTRNIPIGVVEAIKAVFGNPSPAFERFRQAGGRMSWAKLRGLDEIEREISDRLDGLKLSNAHRKAAKPVALIMEGWNDVWENAHRYALFKAAIDKGLPEAQAVKAALEGTLNFNRRGSGVLVKAARIIYPFMNPSIQAPLRAARLIDEAGGLGTAQGKKVAAAAVVRGLTKTYLAFTIAGVAIGMLNYALGGEDDDEIPYWDKAQWNPQSRKNIIIYTGGRDEKGRPNAIMIPAFPEIMLPFHIGNALAASIMGKQKASDVAKQIGLSLAQMSPTEGRGAVPAIVAPLYEIYANKNHFGSPVHPGETAYTRGVPAPERKFSTTDPNWQAFARVMHTATGEKLNLHPEDYRHLARSYVGGWYQISEAIAGGTGMVEPDDKVNVVARRFYLPGSRGVDSYEREKFKEAEGKANEQRFAIKQSVADPANVSARDQRRAVMQNAQKVREQGGIVGRQGGVTTQQATIFDTGRQVMSSISKQRDAAVAKASTPEAKAKVRQDYTERMGAARKQYRKLSDDLTAGKVTWESIQRDLAIARRDARNPRSQ